MQFGRKSIILDLGLNSIVKPVAPSARNPPKCSFPMAGFPIPPHVPPTPHHYKNTFSKITLYVSSPHRERDFSSRRTLGSSWCYFLPVENELGYISPNREINKAQRSRRLEISILLKSFNEKHKGKVLGKKKKFPEKNRS